MSAKQVSAIQRRLARLHGMSNQLQNISNRMDRHFGGRTPDKFVVRRGFAYRANVISDSDISDRALPPRVDSPPARRLMSPRGGALRLMLMLLALRQFRANDPAGPNIDLPIALPRGADEGNLRSLVDVYASLALPKNDGRVVVGPSDKRARHVRAAIDSIALQGLGQRGAPFTLFQEDAGGPDAQPALYRIPALTEPQFSLPTGFITQGWVHVLEDSELLVLLMVACGAGSLPLLGNEIAIPSDERLKRYGIGRDSYATANQTLEEFGLIDVDRVDRHEDGHIVGFHENDELMQVHRFKLLRNNFERDALGAVSGALTSLLGRA